MKTHLVISITIAVFLSETLSTSKARDVTAPELASFLGISSWDTKVTLPPNTYSIDICPIQDGKIGDGLFQGQRDWSKDPDGKFSFMAGPNGNNYRFNMSSKTGGTFGVTTKIPRFDQTYSPALPDAVSEGVYILFVDLLNRDIKGRQSDPATYKRGFVLKVTKQS
jgi:hypothetical protein